MNKALRELTLAEMSVIAGGMVILGEGPPAESAGPIVGGGSPFITIPIGGSSYIPIVGGWVPLALPQPGKP